MVDAFSKTEVREGILLMSSNCLDFLLFFIHVGFVENCIKSAVFGRKNEHLCHLTVLVKIASESLKVLGAKNKEINPTTVIHFDYFIFSLLELTYLAIFFQASLSFSPAQYCWKKGLLKKCPCHFFNVFDMLPKLLDFIFYLF